MIILIIFFFVLGLVIGSFLNCIIFRLKIGEGFWIGRSHCLYCNHNLGVKDLIPVISFSCQKGKCRYCSKKISWQYPIIELVTAILFALAGWFHLDVGLNINIWLLLRDWIFISFLIIIFVYDLKYYLILDKVIWPVAVLALVFNLGLDFSLSTFYNLALSAVVGGGFFLIQYLVSKGKWLGGGDVRLGFLMGLMLGWPGVIIAISSGFERICVELDNCIINKSKFFIAAHL